MTQGAKDRASKLLRDLFGASFFNDSRLEYIFRVTAELSDGQFLNLIDEAIGRETKPGIDWFKSKAQALRLENERPSRIVANHTACRYCSDGGIVFVATPRKGKSLAMRCTCDCKLARDNFWELPVYAADFVIIENPYVAYGKRHGFDKAKQTFLSHMSNSKMIWAGDISNSEGEENGGDLV